MRCLVIGATGYVGARLVPELLEHGHRVRCMVRSPSKARWLKWADEAEIVHGDLFDDSSLRAALTDIEVVYYLAHSLGHDDFVDRDQRAAHLTADFAAEAGVQRIVYLGGLQPRNTTRPSAHLRSREETGRVFLDSTVPSIVLRAAAITGSGSTSFEILRYLTERLPIVLVPIWLTNRTQPIAISDVLQYLTGCAQIPGEINRSFDIGGPDVLTYWSMMQQYALVAGLAPRIPLLVPTLVPRLSAWWIGVITPVPQALVAPLIDSLRHELVCADDDIDATMPTPPRVTYRESVRRALDADTVVASSTDPAAALPTDPDGAGGPQFHETYRVRCSAPVETLWQAIDSVGGTHGWTSIPFVWQLREKIEEVTGGVPAARGRRDQYTLAPGDVVDSWTVASRQPGSNLVLRSEMDLPGEAVMRLSVRSDNSSSLLELALRFRPRGLRGHLYWAAVRPLHGLVFDDIANTIVRRAEQTRLHDTASPCVAARQTERNSHARR